MVTLKNYIRGQLMMQSKTVKQMCEDLDMNYTSVMTAMGAGTFGDKRLKRIADYLGVDVEELRALK